MLSGLVELDADAVAGMSLQNVLQFHLRVLVNVDATLTNNHIMSELII